MSGNKKEFGIQDSEEVIGNRKTTDWNAGALAVKGFERSVEREVRIHTIPTYLINKSSS